jgi:hypothetical protein
MWESSSMDPVTILIIVLLVLLVVFIASRV